MEAAWSTLDKSKIHQMLGRRRCDQDTVNEEIAELHTLLEDMCRGGMEALVHRWGELLDTFDRQGEAALGAQALFAAARANLQRAASASTSVASPGT